jgi:hypothetical protein
MFNSTRNLIRTLFSAVVFVVSGFILVWSGLWQVGLLFGCLIVGYVLVLWGNRLNRTQA